MGESARLLGLETEYAIRFSPAPGHDHPGNALIYRALRFGIRRFVKIKNGDPRSIQEQFFTENGGAFSYEHFLHALDGGLIEGATPECRSAGELLLYQRAQDLLLARAVPVAGRFLRRNGFAGQIGIIKNCRDAEGHIYGAQENYEARVGSGPLLWLYRLATLLFFPPVLALMAAYWASGISLLLVVLSLVFAGMILYGAVLGCLGFLALLIPLKFLGSLRDAVRDIAGEVWSRLDLFFNSNAFRDTVAAGEYHLLVPLQIAALWPYTFSLRLLAFRRQRAALAAYMVSRAIFTGAGTLVEEGVFALSEKGTAIRRLTRLTAGPNDRPLFDNGNLHKALLMAGIDAFFLRFLAFGRLFRSRQRLQIGYSESNRCEVAEYLKIGVTLLLLEMAEAGRLARAPRLKRPIRALQTIVYDPTLKAKVRMRGGGEWSALEIQRRYLELAREYLASGPSVSMEFHEIVRLWEEVLEALEQDPGLLIGRVDWVTKRYLIETAGREASFAARKKIDIAYHELGTGYYEVLAAEGLTASLVAAEEVERALRSPSSPDRVRLRSRLVRDVLYGGERVAISWNSVRVGRFWNRRVVALDSFRRERKIEKNRES